MEGGGGEDEIVNRGVYSVLLQVIGRLECIRQSTSGWFITSGEEKSPRNRSELITSINSETPQQCCRAGHLAINVD